MPKYLLTCHVSTAITAVVSSELPKDVYADGWHALAPYGDYPDVVPTVEDWEVEPLDDDDDSEPDVYVDAAGVARRPARAPRTATCVVYVHNNGVDLAFVRPGQTADNVIDAFIGAVWEEQEFAAVAVRHHAGAFLSEYADPHDYDSLSAAHRTQLREAWSEMTMCTESFHVVEAELPG